MRERNSELKAGARRPRAAKADGESDLLAKIAEMPLICFFQSAAKFKSRYATLGFSDKANLDDGDLWPASFALLELTGDTEARIRALVQQAAS